MPLHEAQKNSANLAARRIAWAGAGKDPAVTGSVIDLHGHVTLQVVQFYNFF